MKRIQTEAAPEPSRGGARDAEVTAAGAESDSDDDPASELSEAIQQFEKLIADCPERFGVLGESDDLRALEGDAAVLAMASGNIAAAQVAADGKAEEYCEEKT
eukprot:1820338-Alexandrium_andersonii.AAC.1